MLMMMDEGWSRRPPFTAPQWQELEQQALIFNYMASGIPIPSHLLLPFKRSRSDPFSLHPVLHFGRRTEEDQEPWRCRRTDGKKWRCSREVFGDSKYCERHRHRGKKYLTKTAETALLTRAAHISSSPSSYSSSSRDKTDRCSNGQTENRGEKKQDHCFLFGADLRLQKPMNVPSENRQVQSPKLQLSFFSGSPDRRNNSWKDPREERATQLSMSISRQ